MTSRDLERARELFLHAVGKLPPEEWEAYVAQACESDSELQRHLAGVPPRAPVHLARLEG